MNDRTKANPLLANQTSEGNGADILKKFRSSAAAMRPVTSQFPGTFIVYGYGSGKFEAGKNKTNLGGRKFLAAVIELIGGYRRYSDSEKKFFYAKCGYARSGHELTPEMNPAPDREDLRWTQTWVLCLADLETREQFALALSSISGKDAALSALQEAYVDHNAGRERVDFEEPIISLASEFSHINSQGKKVFKPLLDIEDWVPLPPWFRVPRLPAEEKPESSSDEPDQDIPF